VILPTLWSAGFVVPRQNDCRTDRRPNHPYCNFSGAGHARLISTHRQNDQDEVFLLKKPNLFVV
jgi:hypothetical protein